MIGREELEQLLAIGHETRSFEVKGPGSVDDKPYVAKVARAAMAMGNLRDGGLVCLGIDDKTVAAMLPGLPPDYVAQWSDFDNVSAKLAKYSDRPVTFTSTAINLSNGVDVVALDVAEFDHIPHVCKQNLQGELQDGMTYVRPLRKPESIPVPSSVEMRELLDLATDKGVREFVRRAGAAGLWPMTRPENEADGERFADEASAAWSNPSEVLSKIDSRGRTDVSIRPGPFDTGRVPPEGLEPFMVQHVVRMRGWPVPYVDARRATFRYDNSVGQDIEPLRVPQMEAWRLCTSGQFLHRRVLISDLRQNAELAPTSGEATGSVVVWDVLLYLVEVAELGARLATALDARTIGFDVSLRGVAGRELISGDWLRELHGRYLAQTDRLAALEEVESTVLLADPRAIGVLLAQRLLRQFGLDVPDAVLRDLQEDVFSR